MSPETRAALALAEAGIPVGSIDRAMRLLDVDAHDNESTVAAKVDELRAEMPGIFAGTPPTTGPARDAAKPRPFVGASGTKTFDELGREALRAAGIRPRETGVDQGAARYRHLHAAPDSDPPTAA